MKRLLLSLLFVLLVTPTWAADPAERLRIRALDEKGVPTFVTGNLGRLAPGRVEASAADVVREKGELLALRGEEEFVPRGTFRDQFGQTHVRLQQQLRGLPVVGGEYIVHADAGGRVFAMNGRLALDRDLPRQPEIDGWTALETAALQLGIGAESFVDSPRLVYVVNEKSNVFLAWSATAAYLGPEGDEIEIVYADATTGDLVLRDAQIQRARSRQTYTANNGTTLPGTLVLSETSGSTSDTTLQAAHNYAGTTYDYYKNVHNRDSYNNAGATIKSTVHYSSNYNNAYWNGTQMVYGDGDGVNFAPLSKALDVDAHELTHAVTEYSADLVYSNESGALNEATSDILAAAAEAWSDGSVNSNTWKIGEDVYTPGTSGDALRYMNNPTADGDSYDYYPERYTGTADYGGVHLNSGIANLAFYLMVQGGTHPRGKTTVSVPALSSTLTTSMDMAAKVWYRALTVYMTSSTTFQGARNATAQAATDLYGATASAAVHKAWDAVGVPGTPGGGGGGVTTLSNGVAVSGLSASTGTWKHYKIAVPSGQSKLEIVQSGGSGDADLYVKRGSQPTSSSYDYRPYLNGNNETVTVTNPVAGDWYVSIYAYSTYSSLTLKATYSTSGGGGGGACTSYSGSLSGTGASAYQPGGSYYYSSVSGTHTGALTGPSGADFDLYLQKWNGSSWSNVKSSEGSTSTENISYSGTSGYYRYRVYSYSGSGSYTLCITKP